MNNLLNSYSSTQNSPLLPDTESKMERVREHEYFT